MGGSLREMHANKIVKAMPMALAYGCPFIAINDSGGARIQEGVDSLGGTHELEVRDLEAVVERPPSGADPGPDHPCPGRPGLTVEVGQPLLVLEAMKMENVIRAPTNGSVATVHVAANQSVIRGEVSAEIT